MLMRQEAVMHVEHLVHMLRTPVQALNCTCTVHAHAGLQATTGTDAVL